MDVQTGDIHEQGEIQKMFERVSMSPEQARAFRLRYRPMVVPPTEKQMARTPPRIGRNDLCPCGSGKKFKKCCLRDPGDKRFNP